jgi:hypothetical protein
MVEIGAARDCNWEARSEADWVRFSTTTGQGPASVGVNVAANPRGVARSTTIVVNEQRLGFSQDARSCRFTLSPSAADVGADEGRVTVQLETLDGCAWRAATTTPWIRVAGEERTGSGSLVVTVLANDDGDIRRGVVTIGGQSLAIAQSGRGAGAPGPSAPVTCTPSVQPATLDVPATVQSHSVDLEIGPGCPWSAASNDSWISLTSPANGSGEARVQFTTAANTGTSARTGSITVAAQRVTVRQLAASEAQPCTYTLDPANRSIPAGGGEGTVTVSTRADCTWSVSDDAGWVSAATDSGQGDATVRYTVQANTGPSARSAIIRIAGRSHRVNQAAAAPACTYSLDPTSQTVSATGGEGRFRVVTQNGCAWSASDNASWTTMTRGSGTGTGEVVFTVQSNSAQQTRVTTITAAGQSHALTQSAAAAPAPACTYSLDPASQTVGASGGEARFRVVTQTDCAWTTAGGANWASIATPGGSGTGEVVVTVQSNSAQQTRVATITAGGQSHALTQSAAAAPACTYSLDPASQTVGASGGEARFRVVTQTDCAWMTSGGANWASFAPPSGSGNGEVVVTVQANPAQQTRATTIAAGGQTHSLTQAAAAAPACTYALDPASQTVGASGGEARFRVVTQAGCAWTPGGGASWATITSGAGSGTGDVVFIVQANTASQTRAATITAGGQSHSVTQAAAAAPVCTYALEPTSQNVGASGGEARFRVATQAGCAWTATGGASWAIITSGAGPGPGDVVFTVQANPAAQTRAATISAGGQSHSLTQAAAAPTCTYSLAPPAQTVPAGGGEARVRVTTQPGCSWSMSGGAAWITIIVGGGSGTADIVMSVQPNTVTQSRAASIAAGGQTHVLTQAAGPAATPTGP